MHLQGQCGSCWFLPLHFTCSLSWRAHWSTLQRLVLRSCLCPPVFQRCARGRFDLAATRRPAGRRESGDSREVSTAVWLLLVSPLQVYVLVCELPELRHPLFLSVQQLVHATPQFLAVMAWREASCALFIVELRRGLPHGGLVLKNLLQTASKPRCQLYFSIRVHRHRSRTFSFQSLAAVGVWVSSEEYRTGFFLGAASENVSVVWACSVRQWTHAYVEIWRFPSSPEMQKFGFSGGWEFQTYST